MDTFFDNPPITLRHSYLRSFTAEDVSIEEGTFWRAVKMILLHCSETGMSLRLGTSSKPVLVALLHWHRLTQREQYSMSISDVPGIADSRSQD